MKTARFLAALALAGALATGSSVHAQIDPKALVLVPHDKIPWKGQPGKVQTAVLLGDPDKEGSLYIMLLKWPPNTFSHPHIHEHERYITVLSGTWWVDTGPKYKPEAMTPVKPGSFVTHIAGGVHYDGAKDEGAVIEIMGIGPAKQIPREEK